MLTTTSAARIAVRLTFRVAVVILIAVPAAAQTIDTSANRNPLHEYESSAEHPWGRPHPEAPPELQQMAFMIGDFDCTDEALRPDGTWNKRQTLWRASYFLNGTAILDQHFKGDHTTTNLRFYNSRAKVWLVSWFRMPPYGISTGWAGVQEGDRVVMKLEGKGAPGQKVVTHLTFFDITADSYQWKSERFVDGELPAGGPHWRIACRRSAAGARD